MILCNTILIDIWYSSQFKIELQFSVHLVIILHRTHEVNLLKY